MVTEDPEHETACRADTERTEEPSDPVEKHVGRSNGVHRPFGRQDVRIGGLLVEVVGHLDLRHDQNDTGIDNKPSNYIVGFWTGQKARSK